jgi:hypothetical protein
MCRPPPHYTAVARAGAAMRGAMELGGLNHENRGFFLLLLSGRSLRKTLRVQVAA